MASPCATMCAALFAFQDMPPLHVWGLFAFHAKLVRQVGSAPHFLLGLMTPIHSESIDIRTRLMVR